MGRAIGGSRNLLTLETQYQTSAKAHVRGGRSPRTLASPIGILRAEASGESTLANSRLLISPMKSRSKWASARRVKLFRPNHRPEMRRHDLTARSLDEVHQSPTKRIQSRSG